MAKPNLTAMVSITAWFCLAVVVFMAQSIMTTDIALAITAADLIAAFLESNQ